MSFIVSLITVRVATSTIFIVAGVIVTIVLLGLSLVYEEEDLSSEEITVSESVNEA